MSNTILNKQPIAPLLADSLATILLFWLMPQLARLFSTPSGLNALLVLVGYILFSTGVFLLRKLEGIGDVSEGPIIIPSRRQVFIGLAILFGIGMMLFLAQQLGYLNLIFTDPYSLGEGQAAAFFVFAPSAWLGVSLLYIPVLAFTVTPTIMPGTVRYEIQSLYALLTSNGMLLLAAAQLKALINDGGFGSFIFSLLLLAAWFGPPRWLYWEKRPSLPSLVTFGLLLLLYSWQIIA